MFVSVCVFLFPFDVIALNLQLIEKNIYNNM